MTRLVAIDWGTSSLRGALLDAGGKVLEERSDARGILTVPEGGFPAVFETLFGDWMRLEGTRCLISGMAGSKQGWVEAPYCACPAGRVEVGRKIIDIDAIPGARIAIVPGLSDEHAGVPDVMRGEEVQIFGAMELTGLSEGVFVLPGTHNKWATVKGPRRGLPHLHDGRVLCAAEPALDPGAHARRLGAARRSLVPRRRDAAPRTDTACCTTPSARARSRCSSACRREELASYLSGLLIGEELRTQSLQAAGEVILIGSSALTQRYTLALRATGVATRTLGAEATWAGLHALSGFSIPTEFTA